jgi:hypothetical protein
LPGGKTLEATTIATRPALGPMPNCGSIFAVDLPCAVRLRAGTEKLECARARPEIRHPVTQRAANSRKPRRFVGGVKVTELREGSVIAEGPLDYVSANEASKLIWAGSIAGVIRT